MWQMFKYHIPAQAAVIICGVYAVAMAIAAYDYNHPETVKKRVEACPTYSGTVISADYYYWRSGDSSGYGRLLILEDADGNRWTRRRGLHSVTVVGDVLHFGPDDNGDVALLSVERCKR